MAVARYQQIRAIFEEQILAGKLGPGDRLPSEADIQAEFAVSRPTAQKALNELAQSGLVIRQRGRAGTYVPHSSDEPREINLARYLDPRVSGMRPGPTGRHTTLSAEVILAGEALVDLPNIQENTPVTQLVRLKHDLNDQPMIIEVAAVPFALLPKLINEDMRERTIRGYFTESGVAINRSRMYIDPVLLSREHADLLGLEPGIAIHRQRRYLWLANGDLAESAAYYAHPEAQELYVEHFEIPE